MTENATPTPPTTEGGPVVRSAAARPILIATGIIGACALGVTGTTAALGAIDTHFSASGAASSATSVDVAGVSEVEVDAGLAEFTLAFKDVTEASLDVSGPGSDRWSMTRDGAELTIKGPQRALNTCLFGVCDRREQSAVLTLPRDLEDHVINVDVRIAAGVFHAEGAFGDVGLEVGAGEATIRGTARSLSLDVGAGDATVELADVSEADLNISAGTAHATLTGAAPSEVNADVSMGTLNLTLPDAAYRVATETSMGGIANGLRMDATSPNLVNAKVSLGDINLRQGK